MHRQGGWLCALCESDGLSPRGELFNNRSPIALLDALSTLVFEHF